MIDYINNLNAKQYEVVKEVEGPVLVLAGAGSGKTRVLTARVAHLVRDLGVDPKQVLAITFTNKAAKEMRDRLSTMIDVEGMWVSTIHSMCVKILRPNIELLGYDSNFSIYDEQDKKRIIKQALKEANASDDADDKDIKSYIDAISMAKTYYLNPRDYFLNGSDSINGNKKLVVFDFYEDYLFRSNALDFDDLLIKTYDLFTNYPKVLLNYAKRFKYIHVDEFQDTNTVQYEIIKQLSSYYGNIFVVGDDDQSIYSWRGSRISNILDFDKEYKGTKIFKLEQNYRSTKSILDTANKVIKNNDERRDKTLWSENSIGEKPKFFVAGDQNMESFYITGEIKKLISYGEDYSSIAILMRVNSLSNKIEKDLIANGIPYRVYGGLKFSERKEVKDIFAYLKLLVNHRDNESLLRIINVPRRGIGESTVDELLKVTSKNGISIYDYLGLKFYENMPVSKQKKLIEFYELISYLSDYAYDHNIAETILEVINKTKYVELLDEKKEEDRDRIENVYSIHADAKQFIEDNGNISLVDYLTINSLSSDVDSINEGNAVTLATIHAVKGLEYDNVFIMGMEDGVIPFFARVPGSSEYQEERRLMYVAITRAKKRLYLTRAIERSRFGWSENNPESPFVEEMEDCLDFVNPWVRNQRGGYVDKRDKQKSFDDYGSKNRGYSSSKEYLKDDTIYSTPSFTRGSSISFKGLNDETKKKTEVKKETRYKVGQIVNHKKYGNGEVIKVVEIGNGVQAVDVAFDDYGIKTLISNMAPMEVIVK